MRGGELGPFGPGCGPLKPASAVFTFARVTLTRALPQRPRASRAGWRRQRQRAGRDAAAGRRPGERLPAPVAE